MAESKFVYVIFIRTTRERLWDALRKPEFTKQFWHGCWQECDWKVGSSWKFIFRDGSLMDAGEVLEFDPPRRYVLSWQNQIRPELKAEGFVRMTFELEEIEDTVRLTVTGVMDREDAKFIDGMSMGFPPVLSSLKSFLETGVPFSPSKIEAFINRAIENNPRWS